MITDWPAIRSEFPALRNWTFLNTATFGQVPRRAVEAMESHFAHRNDLACQDFLDWFEDHDRLRGKIGEFVNCGPQDVAFLPTACSALSLLLNGLDWRRGDEILTLKDEFPNQIYHPGLLARHGVSLREVAFEDLAGSLTDRTRLVVFSTASYVTGLRPPLEGLAARLRAQNILLALDGTQTVGALRFDFRQVQPDFLAVDCYKWMLTPNGAGFLVTSPELRGRLSPQVVGWRSHWKWRQVDSLHHGPPEFSEAAEKYEGGMLPSSLLYALEAVVDMMTGIGTEAIERRVLDLAGQAREVLRKLGAQVLDQPAEYFQSAIVAARFGSRDSSALSLALKEQRVLASARQGYLRISTHFYNNEEDIASLERILKPLL